MNIQEEQLTSIALQNLEKTTHIKGKWKSYAKKEIDGEVELIIDGRKVKFTVEVKKELRSYHLDNLLKQLQNYSSLMVIAKVITPRLKEELMQHEIAYLEANGNTWLRKEGIYIWIDSNKPLAKEKEKLNRAFTKTGLKVVFHFLIEEETLNLSYREIAHQTDTGLGNVNNIISGLKEKGFLIKMSEDALTLTNKKQLLEKWLDGYEDRLKPALELGTYRFAKNEDFNRWKNLPLAKGETFWGGEAAGDLFTKYLKPAELTIFTKEERKDLIKNYRLVPDTKGNVKVYKKFWNDGLDKQKQVDKNLVPPLLAYADLISTGDKRCIETARKIYEQFLQNRFE